jgi:hypothetical protein
MSQVACPHCRGFVENRSDIATLVVHCPHCRHPFQMPAFEELIIPHAQPLSAVAQQQPQLIVVQTGPRPQKRLKARGWFANSAAVAAAVFGCAALFVFATCGGLYYWAKFEVKSEARKFGDKIVGTPAERANVLRNAKKTLARFGIVDVADNSTCSRTPDSALLDGGGIDSLGKTHDVSVRFAVLQFGDRTRWEAKSVMIDGEEMVVAGDPN